MAMLNEPNELGFFLKLHCCHELRLKSLSILSKVFTFAYQESPEDLVHKSRLFQSV